MANVLKVVSPGVNYGGGVCSRTIEVRYVDDAGVSRRMANVARDFHLKLEELTDAQFHALAIECGA